MNKKIIILLLVALVALAGISAYMSRDDGVLERAAENLEKGTSTPQEGAAKPSPAVAQAAVESYIRANISSLAPEKETVGGKFFVTKIAFAQGNAGTVDYEDGHNAYTARFEYSADSDGVIITSFVLAERNPPPQTSTTTVAANFSKAGNMVQNLDRDGWDLVYEEPGKPALRASLVFGPGSTCVQGGSESPCEGVRWKAGDRVRADGRLENGLLTVLKVTKL